MNAQITKSYEHNGQLIICIGFDDGKHWRDIMLDIGGPNAPPNADLDEWRKGNKTLLIQGRVLGLGS